MQSSLELPQTLLKFWWRYCCIGHPSLTCMNSPSATISYSKLWSLLWFIHDNLKWAAKLNARIHLIHLHHLWNLNSGTYQRNNYAGITATGSTQFLKSVSSCSTAQYSWQFIGNQTFGSCVHATLNCKWRTHKQANLMCI